MVPSLPKSHLFAKVDGGTYYHGNMFVLGTDNRIWHNHDYYGGHAGFTSVGDQTFLNNPTVVSVSDGRVDIFAIAQDKSAMYNTFQHMTNLTDGVWTGWKSLGGYFDSSLTAVGLKETTTISVFGISTSGALWYCEGNGSVWPGNWQNHNGIFANAADRRVFLSRYSRRAWSGARRGCLASTARSGWSMDAGNGELRKSTRLSARLIMKDNWTGRLDFVLWVERFVTFICVCM